MAKTFSIIKKENLLTKEESIERFTWQENDDTKKSRVIKKLERSAATVNDSSLYRYYYDENMYMHILPGISQNLVNELSQHIFSYAYAVCRKKGKKENVLYLSMFKDTAMRFKNRIPAATIRVNKKDYPNPDYYIKELRFVI